MPQALSGGELRAVARLVLLAKKFGVQLLNDPEPFDKLLGPAQFAVLDGEILQLARPYLQEGIDRVAVGA